MVNIDVYTGFPKPEEMKPIVEGLKVEFGSNPFGLYTIEWSGSRMGDVLVEELKKGEFDYVRGRLEPGSNYDPDVNSYREMNLISDTMIRDGGYVLIFDDETRSGLTLASGVRWALDNLPEASRIYTAVFKDRIGIANISSIQEFENFLGPLEFMKEFDPEDYGKIPKSQLKKVCNKLLNLQNKRNGNVAEMQLKILQSL